MNTFYAVLVLGVLVGGCAYLDSTWNREPSSGAAGGSRQREHKIAMALAVAVGGIIGVLAGFAQREYRYSGLINWISDYTGDATLWAGIGAFIAGAAIYCVRVLKKP